MEHYRLPKFERLWREVVWTLMLFLFAAYSLYIVGGRMDSNGFMAFTAMSYVVVVGAVFSTAAMTNAAVEDYFDASFDYFEVIYHAVVRTRSGVVIYYLAHERHSFRHIELGYITIDGIVAEMRLRFFQWINANGHEYVRPADDDDLYFLEDYIE